MCGPRSEDRYHVHHVTGLGALFITKVLLKLLVLFYLLTHRSSDF